MGEWVWFGFLSGFYSPERLSRFSLEFSISSSNSPWFWDQTALQSVTSGVRAAHILWSKSWEIEIDSLNLSYIIATEATLNATG